MNDPHVQSLRYAVTLGDNLVFKSPPPIQDSTDEFDLRLNDEQLTFALKKHFDSIASARTFVDPYLWSWELDAALFRGRRSFRFTFVDGEVIDRDPSPPPGLGAELSTRLRGVAFGTSVLTANLVGLLHSYPSPPKLFRVSPTVDSLWHRFEGYQNGREPLQSMAYFCLSLLESAAGNRKRLSVQYRFHMEVLSKLGWLVSERGDLRTARKVKGTKAMTPLSSKEIAWIEAVVMALIRRGGEIGQSAQVQVIRLQDLPSLS